MSYKFNKFHEEEGVDTDIVTGVGDPRYLKLDQTTPQTIANGIPVIEEGLTVEGDFVNQDLNSLDMGYSNIHDNRGYNEEYITDKTIYNAKIGWSIFDEEGSIRTFDGLLEIFLNSVWNDVVVNFRFRENADNSYALEHSPIGFNEYYEVYSGNSVEKGLNGLPLIQNYVSSMGAYPVPLELDGGIF